MTNNQYSKTYRLPPINLLMICLEISFILLAIFLFTRHLQNWSPNYSYGGADLSLLTDGAAFASAIFKRSGTIPIWDPFIGNGEPMLESPQSFILNPLMSLPILILGPIQGAKLGVLLHIGLMGVGGWALGRVLRMRSGGRVLLGVLLASSGSMAAPLGRGLYQLGLSQVDMIWVFAGLIGTLYLRRRLYIGVLAVSATLLIFAGTFWYVLPTIISSAILSAFALLAWNKEVKRIEINTRILGRLILAGIFVLGLTAIRTITINRTLLRHPQTSEGLSAGIFDMLDTYVAPVTPHPEHTDWWQNYHYVIPKVFLALILTLRLTVYLRRNPLAGGRWRILVPALIIIAVFTIWAEGDVPIVLWMQQHISFLADWRNTGRIAAAATPWVLVIATLFFDDTLYFLRHSLTSPMSRVVDNKPIGFLASVRRSPFWAQLGLLLLIGTALWSITSVSENWAKYDNTPKVDWSDAAPGERSGLQAIRAQHPNEMLNVQNQAWITHFNFVNTLARHHFGDADVFTVGLQSTLGPESVMPLLPSYAVGVNPDFVNGMRGQGYEPIPDSPQLYGQYSAWFNPRNPPYAFWTLRSTIEQRDWHPLDILEVTPVTYYHRITSIEVDLDERVPNMVVVADETDYPGWIVTINGAPANVESVGGRLGVILPNEWDGISQTKIVFSYRPILLYLGGLVTLLSFLGFVVFILRLDLRIPVHVRARAVSLAEQMVHVMTSTEVLEPKPETEETKRLPAPAIPLLAPPKPQQQNGNGESEPTTEEETPIIS